MKNRSQKPEVRSQKFGALALCLLCFFAALSVRAADRITATVTLTNGPTTNGMTFVINSDTRTWTNSVFNSASQVLTNLTKDGSTTNLYNHLLSTRPTDVAPYLTASNIIRLDARTGVPLTISGVGSYYSVTYSTQTVSSATNVLVPYSALPSGARPMIASGLVDWLSLATNSIYENGTAVARLVGLTNSQSNITGDKTFTGVVLVSNVAGVVQIGVVRATNFTGVINLLSNGLLVSSTLLNPTTTNLVNYGNAIRSPGTGSLSEQFGTSAAASGDESVAIGQGATIAGTASTGVGSACQTYDNFSVAIGDSATVVPPFGTALGTTTTVDSGHTNSTAIGFGTTTTAKNQIRLGRSSESVSIPGGLKVEGVITNANFGSTNYFPAGADISFGRYAVTSLANGNNAAVPVGTNVFVEVSGPSAAFTICGINASPNRDGKLIVIVNQTGFDMTIAHQSGTDPTAGNRIINMTGADRTTTGNGSATLIYSGSASRWLLISFDP